MATSWPRLLCSYGLLFLSSFMVTLLFVNRHPKPRYESPQEIPTEHENQSFIEFPSIRFCFQHSIGALHIPMSPMLSPPKKNTTKTQPETQLRLLSCLFLITVYLGTKGLVHSEAELLKLSVLHPLFNTEAGGTVIPEVLTNTAKVSGVFCSKHQPEIRCKIHIFY